MKGIGFGLALVFLLSALGEALGGTKFYDNGKEALQARNIGLAEANVPIFFRGRLIGGRKHEVIEGFFQVRKRRSFPQVFADLHANTFFRSTYQKRSGKSGAFGTSIVGSPSIRKTAGSLELIPTVRKGRVFASGRRQRYRSIIEAQFTGDANVTSIRRLRRVAPNKTIFDFTTRFKATSDIDLATGGDFTGNDRFRLITFSSMFSGANRFDANAIRIHQPGGAVTTIPITEATPRGDHLLPAPLEIGSWVELVKGRGSTWFRDSPTIRIRIKNRAGLRLGVQGFLDASTDPNDDSLSVWLEWLDAPDTIPNGTQMTLTFEVRATPPR